MKFTQSLAFGTPLCGYFAVVKQLLQSNDVENYSRSWWVIQHGKAATLQLSKRKWLQQGGIGSATIVAFSLVESACLATTTGLLALLKLYYTTMHIIGIETKGLGHIALRKQCWTTCRHRVICFYCSFSQTLENCTFHLDTVYIFDRKLFCVVKWNIFGIVKSSGSLDPDHQKVKQAIKRRHDR